MAEIKGGKEFRRKIRLLADKLGSQKTLRVGFLEGATYPNGTPVAMVAAIHNYGAPKAKIPSRPFFSNMIADKSGQWPNMLVKFMKDSNLDATKSLTQLGEVISGQLRDSINNGAYAPLRPATIARKGFDKPLIDTGHMVNSIDYDIK